MTITGLTGRDEPDHLRTVSLNALIFTNPETSKKSIEIVSNGGPCGVPEERWLPVWAFGSELTGTYWFNGETIRKEDIHARMRAYIEENYAELLK